MVSGQSGLLLKENPNSVRSAIFHFFSILKETNLYRLHPLTYMHGNFQVSSTSESTLELL